MECTALEMINIYGLKKCDTCQKAQKWLRSECLEHQFLDIRQTVVTKRETIARWILIVGWESLINRRGTTWRLLKEKDKKNLDEPNFLALVKAQPTLIKRPVFEIEETVLVGFKDDVRNTLKGLKND